MNNPPVMLNSDQKQAVEAIKSFLSPRNPQAAFLLSGAAGTGKTTSLRAALESFEGRVAFTAPTNKAVAVLKGMLEGEDFKPFTATIYSLLGLKMDTSGAVKRIKCEEIEDISKFKVVVVDEASMINETLWMYLQDAMGAGTKFLFVGDRYQLPPVNEKESPVWSLGSGAVLDKVMRHDNSILNLATGIRKALGPDVIFPQVPPQFYQSDNDGRGGVWKIISPAFESLIQRDAEAGLFTISGHSKVISWRNVIVAKYNKLIREVLWGKDALPWVRGDRLVLTEPAKYVDPSEKRWKERMACTDAEGTVEEVAVVEHPDAMGIKCWRISATMDDNSLCIFYTPHPESEAAVKRETEHLANLAKMTPKLWPDFWEYKEKFHAVRPAYSITSHRAQGSTYKRVFVDSSDILLNRNRFEAFRCLYVACTRPSEALYMK